MIPKPNNLKLKSDIDLRCSIKESDFLSAGGDFIEYLKV
jgi:hypothetical protein